MVMVIFRWAGLSHLIWARLFPRAIGDSVSALQCVRLSTLSLTLLHLGSIENYGINKINVASEFVAQYSSRQKYRYPVLPALESSGFNFARENGMCPNFMLFFFFFPPNSATAAIRQSGPVKNVESLLSRLYEQVSTGKSVSFIEVRDALRQAAAILCNEKDAGPSLVHYFVALPFQIFSKESMGTGVSLWLGAMNENPKIESRIMVEVMEAWEETIRRRRGLFNPSFE